MAGADDATGDLAAIGDQHATDDAGRLTCWPLAVLTP
jgi:hypothetical protein